MKGSERAVGLFLASAALVALVALVACTSAPGAPRAANAHTLIGAASYVAGHPASNADGTINVVVEIPAGTNDKWEVDKTDGALRWELEGGAPRVIRYLPYPANYGMIPRTLLPDELGGDGDPLDVVLLGPALARGSVVRARPIGVLELLDGGQRDDKLLAVMDASPLGEVDDLHELDASFPGVTEILERWFTGYKGPGRLESRGFAGALRAREILAAAARAYDERR